MQDHGRNRNLVTNNQSYYFFLLLRFVFISIVPKEYIGISKDI